MNDYLLIIFVTFAAFMISLVGTRLLILTLRENRLLLDIPNSRSNHTKPVPRGGGLAVVMAIVIAMLQADAPFYVILSILILASISFIDDLISIPVVMRLLVQVVAVSISLAFIPVDFLGEAVPDIVEKIALGVAWIWMINLFNFMDGIDGLSAAELCAVGLATTLVLAFDDQFPSLLSHYGMIIAAAGCGFWWWNKSPARIFLGDVGSIPLGFIMGYILILLATHGYIIAALIIPAYYLSDATVTLMKRIYAGKKFWQAHSEHYYQKAARKGRSHAAIVRYVTGINILLGFLAAYSVIMPELWWLFILLAYVITFILLRFFAHENKSTTPPVPS